MKPDIRRLAQVWQSAANETLVMRMAALCGLPMAQVFYEPLTQSCVAWGKQGFRHLTNSRRPVVKPEDAKGLKIRVTDNQTHITAFRQLGIAPTPMMVVIVNLTLGMITPPVGGLPFVVSVATRVPMAALVRELPLFLVAHLVVLLLITFEPATSTWLPHALGF